MPIIQIKELMPDIADFGNPGSVSIKNALPNVSSYQPLPTLVPDTDSLDSRPRGAIESKDKDLNIFQYAGDAGKIYSISSGIWGDVSVLGGYSTGSEEVWEFARWKEKLIATNFTDNPQSITLGGTNFSDMTTALKFRRVGIVRDFVVAGNTFDSTDGNVRDRVRWSAINDETDWAVSPTTLSDFRDLKSGGIQKIIGGEFGIICTDRSTWRMTFVGSPIVFDIAEVIPGVGSISGGAVCILANTVFFPSEHGFVALVGGSSPTFIGAGRVDQFFKNDIDEDYLHRISCVADPSGGRVFWAYPGAGNTAGRPNKLLVFDTNLNKWGYAELEVELIWRSGGVATTLEGLDDNMLGSEVTTNGDFATDTVWTKGTGWTIASGTASHAAGTASNLAQSISPTLDRYYRIEFDVIGRTAGSVTPQVGGISGTAISADTTNEKETIRSGAGSDITFSCTAAFDGSIDNVSLKLINDIDSMSVSMDSSQWKGSAPLLSAFDASFKNGNFNGTPMTAVIETKEIEISEGSRTRLNAFTPLVDGGTVTARIGTRNRQSDAVSYSPVLNQSSTGRFTTRSNANFHRFELTISGDYSDIIGVQVNREDAKKAERRG